MKLVVCFRCKNVYNQDAAPSFLTKRLKLKEKGCPKCECKLYHS